MTVASQQTLRYVFVVLLSLFVPVSVLATGLTWQGPYAGVYLGGGFGDNHISTNAGSVTNLSYFTTSADVASVNSAGTWTKTPSTLIVGIHAGHDWALQKMVYGIMLDYSTLPLNASSTKNPPYPDNIDSYSIYTSIRANWLFTLRGRLGYPLMLKLPSLFYLTGGMAMTQLKAKNDFNDTSVLQGAGRSDTTKNQIGWTAGVGMEVVVFNHISMDVEYLYVDIPSVRTIAGVFNTAGGFGIPVQSMNSTLASSAKFHANLFKLGLNYRFEE